MKIEYALDKSGKCLTDCPNGVKNNFGGILGVSSTYCYRCEHLVSDREYVDEVGKIYGGMVTCNWRVEE